MPLDDRKLTAAALLRERAATHGDFHSVAWVAQELRRVYRHELGWEALSPIQREALDSMASKVGRILSGDPNFADHWSDLCGYATLALNEINEPK